MAVSWLDEVRSTDVGTVGGKAASLGELTDAGLPVPSGFVVTAATYREFIETAGIDEELFDVVDVDHEDSTALREAHERAHQLIVETPMPDEVKRDILDSYYSLDTSGSRTDRDTSDDPDSDPFVAVRSSATAEDLPDASFAGQQETFLNVRSKNLVDRVKGCIREVFCCCR
jgi:pyruvate,water dikinase